MNRSGGSRRTARRRARLAALAGVLAVVPVLVACEVTTTPEYSCSMLGAYVTQVRSNVAPDSVGAGDVVVHELETTLPPQNIDIPVFRVTARLPLPDRVAEVRRVDFEGGTVAGSWQVDGRDLVLAYDARGTSFADLALPTVRLEAVVHPEAPGGTMTWLAPDQLVVDVDFLGTPLTETCTLLAGEPALNNTDIDAPDNSRWTAPPTIVSPPSATTWPTTTTTTPLPTTTTTLPTIPSGASQGVVFEVECAIFGPLPILANTSWSPHPVERGGDVTITADLRLPATPSFFPTNQVDLRFPVPAGLIVDDVTFEPGAGATWTVANGNLDVRFDTGGTPFAEVGLPPLTIAARVAPDAGPVIELPTPSPVTFAVDFGGPFVDSCASTQPSSLAAIAVS